MSKYIPPSIRNKESTTMELRESRPDTRRPRRYYKPHWEVEKEERERQEEEKRKEQELGLENTEQNFPSLGSAKQPNRSWGGRNFAQLATEWKTDEDDKKKIIEMKKETTTPSDYEFVLPKFNNIHRFHEPEDRIRYNSSTEESEENQGEWTSVERKKYVPKIKKTVLDYTEEDFESEHDEQNDDTVWGAEPREEYETCWDERRY